MPKQPGSNPPRRPLSLYERHYRLLEDIIGRPLPDLQSGIVYRLRAEHYMDLVVEVVPQDRDTGALVLSLAHYFESRGDLCQAHLRQLLSPPIAQGPVFQGFEPGEF